MSLLLQTEAVSSPETVQLFCFFVFLLLKKTNCCLAIGFWLRKITRTFEKRISSYTKRFTSFEEVAHPEEERKEPGLGDCAEGPHPGNHDGDVLSPRQ